MRYLILFISVLFFSCESSTESTSQKPVLEVKEVLPKLVSISSDTLREIFHKKNMTGCFLLYDLKNDHYSIHNEKRANQQFRPASTYKIPNSIIALETGVVKDEEQIFKWDGKKKLFRIWEKDHTLRSGIKNSVVWLYQDIARKVGEEQMQHWVDTFEYGNQNIGGGIDMFWLNGDCRITPKQQIDFLKKVHLETLPISKRTYSITKDIMTLEKTNEYVYRGKTGWDNTPDPDIGWFVGYVERNENAYFFACNVDIVKRKDANKRKDIVKEVLQKLKLVD